MKIIYCINEIGVGGGVETITTSKVNWLIMQGHDVEIISCQAPGGRIAIDPRVPITVLGIDYAADFRVPLHKRLINTLVKMRKHKKLMKAYLDKVRPDIVVTTHPVVTAFLPSLEDGSKKIQELHVSQKNYRLEKEPKPYSLRALLVKLYEWRDKYINSRFDAVGCLTQEDLYYRGKPKNMVVIPNALSFNSSEVSQLNNKIVLAAGRFTPQKDFGALIDIWSTLVAKYPEWRLRIIGEGYLRDSLLSQVKRLGLEVHVEILPFSQGMRQYYLYSDIYAMTSLFEGLPMVLLEAQAMGLPIVSYTCPAGPKDVITEGQDGYLVEPADKVSFAQRLELLMSNNELRKEMGRQAKMNSYRYDIDRVMQQWVDLFNQLLAKSNG